MDIKSFLKIFLKHFPMFRITLFGNTIELLEDLKRSRTSIDQKVEKVSESLKETSILIDELETEMLERTKKMSLLKQEYEQYSKLSSIEEEKASALLSQLEKSLGKGKKSERWFNFLISIFSGIVIFILGIIFSPILTPLIGNLFK